MTRRYLSTAEIATLQEKFHDESEGVSLIREFSPELIEVLKTWTRAADPMKDLRSKVQLDSAWCFQLLDTLVELPTAVNMPGYLIIHGQYAKGEYKPPGVRARA